MPEVGRGEVVVGAGDERGAGDGAQQVEVGGLGLVEAGEQAVDDGGRSGPEPSTSEVQPAEGTTRPLNAEDSSARTTVVPTATTRRPTERAELTSRAVAAGTTYSSGCGGSCFSWLATPVCSTSGAIVTPAARSRTSSAAVSGRPALGISALPGWVA